jgi:hypothetical protein
MIQQRLVNMGDQADAASCVPQALPRRRMVAVGNLNAWDATLWSVRERWDPVVARVARDRGTQTTHDRDEGT